jgi:hypothetical protein
MSLLDIAGAYCPEQGVIKINVLSLAVFTAYKVEQITNETGTRY